MHGHMNVKIPLIIWEYYKLVIRANMFFETVEYCEWEPLSRP